MAAPQGGPKRKPKHYRAWIKVGSAALEEIIRLTILLAAILLLFLSDFVSYAAAIGSLIAALKIR
jgi:hypothetical protein